MKGFIVVSTFFIVGEVWNACTRLFRTQISAQIHGWCPPAVVNWGGLSKTRNTHRGTNTFTVHIHQKSSQVATAS